MRIGIDISQLAYERTGVANYLKNLIEHLLEIDSKNQYIFFFSGLRSDLPDYTFLHAKNVTLKKYALPPTALDILWNKLHILPIEYFIGDVDVFITSDWAEPPAKKAKKITVLYDLIVYKYPQETDKKIIAVQKRKLSWVKKETQKIICISESTKNDAQNILGIEKDRLVMVYPAI